jgi:hypothetical protein
VGPDERKQERLRRRLKSETVDLLNDESNWGIVKSFADALLKRQELTGHEIYLLLSTLTAS